MVPPLPWLNPRFNHCRFWNVTSRTSHNTQHETQKQRDKQRLLPAPDTPMVPKVTPDLGLAGALPCGSCHILSHLPLDTSNWFILSDFKRRWKKESGPLWRRFLQISFWIPSQLDLKSKLRSVVLVLEKQIPIPSQQARRDQPPTRE